MYFSIAEQSVQLPDGTVLNFRVNPVNTALVELSIVGDDQHGNAGTHVLSFNRNGTSAGQEFVQTLSPASRDAQGNLINPAIDPVSGNRLDGGFKSVNDDAVRGNARDAEGNLVNPNKAPTQAEVDAEIARGQRQPGTPINPNGTPVSPQKPRDTIVTSTSLDAPHPDV